MNNPEVNVLLPVHNAAGTIAEALESLLAQTFAGFGLVVVDDGCQDETISIVEQVWAGRRPLQIVRPGRVGLVQALQVGLERCKGPWVARMDADDIADPRRLEMQRAHLHAHPRVDVMGCQVRCFHATGLGEGYRLYEGWLNQLLEHEHIIREMYVESPLAHPSVMFRRSAIVALGGYQDRGWPEDYDLWLRGAQAGLRFGKVPEVLLAFRDHAARLSRCDQAYGQKAFLRCKAHYLARGPLADARRVVVWGAGPIGRRLSRFLENEGIETSAFVDIDPRKIGRQKRGAPVIAPGELASGDGCVLVAAVGSRGARAIIREQATRAGFREGESLWCAA